MTKCDLALDSGTTRADYTQVPYVCLHFARGCCYLGQECTYLHRKPTRVDQAKLDMTHDIFGRERHREDRQDMGGVGSMFRENRTLYVNLGGASSYGTERLQDMIRRTFGQFGNIEKLSVKLEKGIAFVTYDIRASAEFAKECVSGQSLLGSTMNEILDVRWSYDDSNPAAVAKRKRDAKDELASAIQQTIVSNSKKKAKDEDDRNFHSGSAQLATASGEGEDDINRYDFDDYDFPSDVEGEDEEEIEAPSGKKEVDQKDEKPKVPESSQAQAEEEPESNPIGLLGLAGYGSDSED